MAAITICSDFGAQESKVCHYFHCFPICLPWNVGTGCYDLHFMNVEFKPAFSFSCFTFVKRLFNSSLLSAIRVMSSAYLRLLTFLYIKKMWKWKSLIRVWLCKPLDYTVHRILQVRIVEWVAYLLQEVFPTQGSNPGLLHCRQILHQLSHKGSPYQENGDSILLVLDPILVLDPRLIV